MRIGIICPSEIAFRRFMPAIQQTAGLEYVGVAFANEQEWFGDKLAEVDEATINRVLSSEQEKAEKFRETYGGEVFSGYQALLQSQKIDAVYLPLPPALHFRWAKEALNNGLHVFLEKPSTTRLADTQALVDIAKTKGLALHENYMFAFHSQLKEMSEAVKSGKIGDVRLYRIDFGFPMRAQGDFRYNAKLGGGALLDCGGYTLKYAAMLLGETAELKCANVLHQDGFEVELAGSATLCNAQGICAQVAFGMDNDYRCSLNVWGSKGSLQSNRVLTAPVGFVPSYDISQNGEVEHINMQADDSFLKSIKHFEYCIKDSETRQKTYQALLKQAGFVEQFIQLSNMRK